MNDGSKVEAFDAAVLWVNWNASQRDLPLTFRWGMVELLPFAPSHKPHYSLHLAIGQAQRFHYFHRRASLAYSKNG